MSIDPAARAGHLDHPPRMGFFTDTSVCIGCKACEVACKEWNAVPEDGLSLSGMSYDNTVGLGASTGGTSRSSSRWSRPAAYCPSSRPITLPPPRQPLPPQRPALPADTSSPSALAPARASAG
jgi:formate dehydrogenase iron-sulfur subunit